MKKPIEDWGLIEYQTALEKQLQYVTEVRQGYRTEVVIVCTHPPVVTVGRATAPGDIQNWSGELVEVQRGGRATYHGPNQLIFYPILDLDKRGRDLHQYLRLLETIVIDFLSEYSIQGVRESGATGVWVPSLKKPQSPVTPEMPSGLQKIASLGVAVKQWVTYHGVAINLDQDPQAFVGIKPCGFNTETMVSLEEVLGKPVSRSEAKSRLQTVLDRNLGPDGFVAVRL